MPIALLGLAPTLTEIECIVAQLYTLGVPFANISILVRTNATDESPDGKPHHVTAEGIVRLLAGNALHPGPHGTTYLVGGPMGAAMDRLPVEGLASCLIEFGVPTEDADAFASLLPQGGVLLAVCLETGSVEPAAGILRQNGADHFTHAEVPEKITHAALVPM